MEAHLASVRCLTDMSRSFGFNGAAQPAHRLAIQRDIHTEGTMLVLSRKTGERLVLIMGCHEATIELLSMTGNRAQVGIDAPRQIKVVREEVYCKARTDSVLREIA